MRVSIVYLLFLLIIVSADLEMDEELMELNSRTLENYQSVKRWELALTKFKLEDLISVIIKSKDKFLKIELDKQILYEYIEKDYYIRGAFLTSILKSPDNAIKMQIVSPEGLVRWTSRDTHDSVFYNIQAKSSGEYMFKFENLKTKDMELSIAINIGPDTHLTTPADEKPYENIGNDVSNLFMLQKAFHMRHVSLFETDLENVGKRQLIFSVVESLAIILVTIWQIIYIKKLLDFGRVI